MPWPTPVDYVTAVGNFPDHCILDAKLKGGQPKKDSNKLLIYSGGFSTVFPIEVSTNTYALRCWMRNIGDAKNRYKETSTYLKQVGLPYFVDFAYVAEGILINGQRYPITRMEWAAGETLRDFISQNLQTPSIFKTLADKFQKMFADLHAHQISHGDLQDGNILVQRNGTDVDIKLIDYDSLFVPALQGHDSPTPGLPDYQHPAKGMLCNEKVDYFSELVIYLSFLSLAEKPELWKQFKDRTERGLLFAKKDFENPDQSPVFKELANLSADIQKLAAKLKEFCRASSIDELKPLEDILPKPDPKAHCKQGFEHLSNNNYADARAEFEQALTLNPSHAEAHFGLGQVHLHNRQHSQAIQHLQQATNISPDYTEAHHGLGLAYYQQQDYINARTAANAALGIDSTYPPAKELLDVIASSTRPKPTPSPKLKPPQTATKPPPDPPPIKGAQDSIPSNFPKDSINFWRICAGALAISFLICLVVIANQAGDKKRALLQVSSRDSSIQVMEEDMKALDLKNRRLEGQLSQANSENRRLERQLSQANSENRRLERQLSGKNEEIQRLRSLGIPEKPRKIDEYRNKYTRAAHNHRLGITAFELEEYDKAVTYFKRAAEAANLAQMMTGDYYNLGCAYLQLAKYDEAINAFAKVTSSYYGFKEAHYNLGLAYLRKGHSASAKHCLDRALSIDRNYQRASDLLDTIHTSE